MAPRRRRMQPTCSNLVHLMSHQSYKKVTCGVIPPVSSRRLICALYTNAPSTWSKGTTHSPPSWLRGDVWLARRETATVKRQFTTTALDQKRWRSWPRPAWTRPLIVTTSPFLPVAPRELPYIELSHKNSRTLLAEPLAGQPNVLKTSARGVSDINIRLETVKILETLHLHVRFFVDEISARTAQIRRNLEKWD